MLLRSLFSFPFISLLFHIHVSCIRCSKLKRFRKGQTEFLKSSNSDSCRIYDVGSLNVQLLCFETNTISSIAFI
jgi:hypothetical protein